METQGSTGSLRVVNIGGLYTGSAQAPYREDVDVLTCREGQIESLHDSSGGDELPTLDVNGADVVPGLIDPHVHPVFGDFTPRHTTVGWIESYVHGGVTTLISAGEPHLPGRPRNKDAAKALALLASQSFGSVRPLGATVHAGAVLLEEGLTDQDFQELKDQGVWLLAEIGIASVADVERAAPMVAAAKRHGFHTSVHVGGASVPGSSVIGADVVLALQPAVAVHCNGGPTAPPPADLARIVNESGCGVEVVQAGNMRACLDVISLLREADQLGRLQLGSDTPSGTGVIPSAILRMLAFTVALGGVEPAEAVCAATGNTAIRFGLEVGRIEPGRPADLTVLSAPRGSVGADLAQALRAGDMPAVSAVVSSGSVRLTQSRVTPPPQRSARLVA